MRQRLSSEPDRYRGRRRVPTPPRSRYAVVVTSAFVGAGVVALGATNFPDAKAVSPTVLANLENASVAANGLAERDADSDRASRDNERGEAATKASEAKAEADAWRLPLDEYTFTSGFGVRFAKLHAGIDLAALEGTPYKAVHGGKVKAAGYQGAYGYSVTVAHPDGTETIYAHSRRVLVKKGQYVKAGDILGEVGSSGYAYGTHLHVEIHVKGQPVDPAPLLRRHGVDIQLKIESVYGGVTGAAS